MLETGDITIAFPETEVLEHSSRYNLAKEKDKHQAFREYCRLELIGYCLIGKI